MLQARQQDAHQFTEDGISIETDCTVQISYLQKATRTTRVLCPITLDLDPLSLRKGAELAKSKSPPHHIPFVFFRNA